MNILKIIHVTVQLGHPKLSALLRKWTEQLRVERNILFIFNVMSPIVLTKVTLAL